MDQETIIENHIKELRKIHNMSQEGLALALGISRQSIIALEQGKSLPSLPLVISICRFFDSAFEDIFCFENEQKNIINICESSEKDDKIRKEPIMANELEPKRPFREMVSLRDAMDRLFEDSFISPKSSAIPKIDIIDKKDKILVKAEIPGMSEEDINIEIIDNIMTISGEKKEEKVESDEGYFYKESHTGTFSRSFSLPGEVDEEKADAVIKNGILEISVPKIKPKKATKIAIKK